MTTDESARPLVVGGGLLHRRRRQVSRCCSSSALLPCSERLGSTTPFYRHDVPALEPAEGGLKWWARWAKVKPFLP